MGLKRKRCSTCCLMKLIGRSKSICKSCRRIKAKQVGSSRFDTKSRTPGPAYSDRNRLVVELGYENYNDYLSSPLWAGIRTRVLAHLNPICRLCGKAGKQIHHLNYSRDTLLGKKLDGMIVLCYRCHRKCEYKGGNVKRSLADTTAYTRKRLEEREGRVKPS